MHELAPRRVHSHHNLNPKAHPDLGRATDHPEVHDPHHGTHSPAGTGYHHRIDPTAGHDHDAAHPQG